MGPKYRWLGILVLVSIIVQIEAKDYKRFEKIYHAKNSIEYDSSLEYEISRKELKFGKHFITDDNSFFFLNLSYNINRQMTDEINYTVTINVPQDPWNSENITKYVCSSNIRTPIKNPILTEELIANNSNLPATELAKVRVSHLQFAGTERLSRDKVMIVWHEKYLNANPRLGERDIISGVNVTINIIDVKTCTSTDIKFNADSDFELRDVKIVVYENSFDIFTCEHKLCKSPTSKITYDFFGHQIGDTVDLKNQLKKYKLINFTPLILKSFTADGFETILASEDDETIKTIAHLSRDGTKKQIFHMNSSVEDLVMSNSYGKYRVCRIKDGIIHFSEFMGENIIMNKTLGISEKFSRAGIYNSKDGGFYLVTRNCENDFCDEFKIRRINSDGDLEKSMLSPKSDLNFKCKPWKIMFNLSENLSDFCIHSLCGNDDVDDLLFSVFCVPKSKLDL